MTIYHIGGKTRDDFDQPLLRQKGEALYDAKTKYGPWATMTQASYDRHAAPGGLGTGKGQKYVYDGENYVKVEG